MKANECYLLTKKNRVLLNFGRTLTTMTVNLFSAGQLSTVGVPIPLNGSVKALCVFDGVNAYLATGAKSVNAQDRISVRAVYQAPYYTVVVRVNDSDTSLMVSQVSANSDVSATVLLELVENW